MWGTVRPRPCAEAVIPNSTIARPRNKHIRRRILTSHRSYIPILAPGIRVCNAPVLAMVLEVRLTAFLCVSMVDTVGASLSLAGR